MPVRGAWITVHRKIRLALDVERDIFFLQRRPQDDENLLDRLAGIKNAPIQITLIDRHLLERLDQVGGAVEIGCQQRGSILDDFEELGQARSLQLAARDIGRERGALALQRRRDRQAGSDRAVDLVRHAGH